MVLRIVRACETRDLEPELVELALDSGEPATLRALAIRGLERFGSEGGRASLVSLALRSLSEDEDETEEVRGAALDATYTHCLDIEETLASLTEPREHEGGYMHFLRWTLPAGITADDLPVALRWATEVEPLATHESGLNSVVDAILERAWPRVRDPEIGERLASVVHERLRRRIAPFGREHAADIASPFRDADRRRMLLRYLVNWATDPLETTGELRPDLLVDAEPPLLCDEDRAWLLDRVEETIGGPAEIRWISLILWVAYMEEPELERLFGLFEHSELLRQRIAPTYEDIPIARGLARVGRERFEKEFPELALARPSGRDQEIRTALAASERGDLDAWRRLNESMRFGPEDRDEDVDEREADLTRTPGWKRADAATRERILIAARSFIERADPCEDESPDPQSPTEESFDPQSVFVTGCRALLLLAARAPSSLKELGESTWGRWAPIIFDLSIETFSPEEEAVAQWLFVAAAEGAPVEVADWATAIVERRVKAGADHLGLVGRLERVHNQPLTDALLAKLTEPMRPGVLGELLTWAIAREPQRAAELVRPRLAPDAIADSADSRASARAVAKVLLEDLPSVGWPVVRGFLETDRALGIEVLREATAWGPIETGDLDDVQLAELVTVVLDLSPFDIEPGGSNGDNAEAPERAEALTPPGYRLEAIRSTQAQLLGALSERGSAEAVAAVEDLHRRFPDHVPRTVLRAVKEARRSQSRALGPRQVLLLCSSNTARVVFSDRGLQEAVMASLGRIQRRLREGRSPAAPELWSGKQPRKEEELSDWLARELERDLSTGGKFVGREVQVKPNPTGRGRGSSTDILVSAPIGELVDGSETVTVVLEVKGCWEPKVKTRMKDQLVEDYLASLGTRCGIYVVFWFPLDEWTPEDSNRGRGVSGMESASVRELFKAQAEELGEGDDLSIESFVFDCTLRRPGQRGSSSLRAAISGQEDRRDQGATTRRETGGGDAER
jgi:hypothetical protein